MRRRAAAALRLAVAAGVLALFAGALLGASRQPAAEPPVGEGVPTLFGGQLTLRDGGGARALLTALEPGAGYAPIRARLALDLLDGDCARPSGGRMRLVGPTGGGGAVELSVDDATCDRAVGTYAGGDGAWSDRAGRFTLDTGEDGQVLLGLYP
jgi:hypothetical protein